MPDLKLNETPIRTSKNFRSNNIVVKNVNIPEDIKQFNNLSIESNSSEIIMDDKVENKELRYGLSKELENIVFEKANHKIRLIINGKVNEDVIINFVFDKENLDLVENIEIVANENTSANIFIKYTCNEEAKCPNSNCDNMECPKNANVVEDEVIYFHNGIIKTYAKDN